MILIDIGHHAHIRLFRNLAGAFEKKGKALRLVHSGQHCDDCMLKPFKRVCNLSCTPFKPPGIQAVK